MPSCMCARVRARVCVCVCVKISEDSDFCISGIIQSIELKFDVYLKQKLSFISFSSKFVHELKSYHTLNFFLNVYNRSSCRKF